jgi:hypothetical protein
MRRATVVLMAVFALPAAATPPVVKYIFPAGAQRGTTANVKVGGCFFHGDAGFEMLGLGVTVSPRIKEVETVWFEGPLIPQPASQQAEDYPRDHACTVKVAADAAVGVRLWRAWTSQGATPAMRFVIGDLPEVVEREVEGTPTPVEVTMPITVNGRIFPREDVDEWSFGAKAGQAITCEVMAKRLGSPLEAQVEIVGPDGAPVTAKVVRVQGDPRLHFTAATAGDYRVRINDVGFGGLQNFVYRMTVTAGPFVDSVYPLGGRRGGKTRFELTGHGLGATSAEADLPPDAGAELQRQFEQGGTRTNAITLDLDDLPEHLEAEPHDAAAGVKPLAVPAVFNGRIDRAGDADVWAFAAKRDEAFDVEVRAARLGSPLDSVLTISDAAGRQLARGDDTAAGQTDSQVSFKAPADGVYYVRVEDRFASRGGPAFAYRLRVAAARPDFQLTLASDAITLPRTSDAPATTADGKKPAPASANVKVDAQRLGGFDGAINLAIDGLPDGVTATETVIAAKKATTTVKLTAKPGTKIRVSRLRVRGVADVAGKSLTRVAAAPVAPTAAAAGQPAPPPGTPGLGQHIDDILLSVAMPTPFKSVGLFEQVFIPTGSVYHRRYLLERGGFEGPLTVRLTDRQARHLQGVTGPTLTVPPGAGSFDYPVTLAAEMELGRTSRSCIMLLGTVKDFDGSEHVVSYSSTEQPDQFVAVATAGLLGVRVERSSLVAEPGKTVELAVHVRRAAGLAGRPVQVELALPPGTADVSSDALTIAGDKDQGTLRVRLGKAPGPFATPATIRATATATGSEDPHRAESKVELLPVDRDE